MQTVFEVLSLHIAESFKVLLETRHLYQTFQMEIGEIIESAGQLQPTQEHLASVVKGPWHALGPQDDSKSTVGSPTMVAFQFLDAKLHCGRCARREAYNVKGITDLLPYGTGTRSFRDGDKTVQVFVLNLQCQSCKGTPELFLIRREGFKLMICGRSPIEQIEVPAYVPKKIRRFLSGALLAHQSGQTLAGNFMLRTLIEQWSREWARQTGDSATIELISGRAADLVEAYTQSLPSDIRGRIPSCAETYRKLSDDIHAAKGDVAIFETALNEIQRHFDARRVFDLVLPEADKVEDEAKA